MEYLIVEDGVIVNSIVCENDEVAEYFGAVPSYDNARIGEPYNPPEPAPEPEAEVTTEEMAAAILEGVNDV